MMLYQLLEHAGDYALIHRCLMDYLHAAITTAQATIEEAYITPRNTR